MLEFVRMPFKLMSIGIIDMKRKILLGLTGSVASVLYEKLVAELNTIGDVITVLTPRAEHFVSDDFAGVKVIHDHCEWGWFHPNKEVDDKVWNENNHYDSKWQKNDPILHIKLRDNASALVIAPCSANTLAKLANGISDNLLLSIARAWDFNRPFIVAPSMNTHMWEHPITQEHIAKLKSWGVKFVKPQIKMLACNTEGMGALAEISEIVKTTNDSLRWHFPLTHPEHLTYLCSGIPVTGHPGSFLHKRKMHTHTGVDLYTNDGAVIYAVENGKVVGIEDFTGNKQNTPWWEDTKCLLVEGASGVVCYGEITPVDFSMGTSIERGEIIGRVKRVLKTGKERPDIEGHSLSMLHIEMYKHGVYRAFEENGENLSDWNDLRDPTQFLIDSMGAPTKLLKGAVFQPMGVAGKIENVMSTTPTLKG